MYEAETSEELDTLVKDKYSIYCGGSDNRTSEEYRLNEENISRTYQRVYEEVKMNGGLAYMIPSL